MKSDSYSSWIQLFHRDPSQAWQDFLKTNDKLIKRIIQRMVNDYDDQMELYTFTLEQLKCHDYKKLTRYFDKIRSFNFKTWTAVVVRNCCMDWFRQKNGRKRLSTSIKELSPLDQLIFKYIYQWGFSFETTFEMLKNVPGNPITLQDLCSRAEQINKLLQKKTRWKLENEWKEILPPLSLESLENGALKNLQQDPAQENDPDPENQLLQSAALEKLKKIMAGLPAEQKLILHLHFYKGLTIQEMTTLLKYKNIWQVHRKLRKALKSLQKKLQEENIELSDLNFS